VMSTLLRNLKSWGSVCRWQNSFRKSTRSLLIPFLIKIILFRIVIKNQSIPINIPGHHHIFQEIPIPFSDSWIIPGFSKRLQEDLLPYRISVR
jgi:hypothetical protein